MLRVARIRFLLLSSHDLLLLLRPVKKQQSETDQGNISNEIPSFLSLSLSEKADNFTMSFLIEIFLSFFLSFHYVLFALRCVAVCCRTNSSFSSLIIESSSGSSGVSLELAPDAGGGKGWPTNASVVLYHREQAIIIAGSDSGAVYAYGDGFQYMKAPEDLQDPKAVIFLLSMSEDQVLAVYEDNSMTMLNLPHLTSTGAALPSNWLLQGAISCVRRDDYNKDKMYVYVGTTNGSLFVLDCTLPAQIRECDYTVTLEDVNLVEMSISDIQGK